MYKTREGLVFSPSDLTSFLDSDFASWMDRWHSERHCVADGSRAPKLNEANVGSPHPSITVCSPDQADEGLQLLARMGEEHEQSFLAQLRAQGKDVAEVDRDKDASQNTLDLMRSGVAIIYQACLGHENWGGYPDFLAKLDQPSKLGDHHYEVWDTKLAKAARPYFLIQLCAYAEMLQHLQGVRPQEVEVILGTGQRRRFKTDQFFYYFRELKRAFIRFHAAFDGSSMPHPGLSKAYGRWGEFAEQIFACTDHLSCVAGMTRNQIRKLEGAGITTVTTLTTTVMPHVPNLAPDVFRRLRLQAKLQLESRGCDRPSFEVVTPALDDPRRGLAILPPPSAADVFFDMEGYPLAQGGLEYLFGAVYLDQGKPVFTDWWAHNPVQEKAAFEGFVDWVFARWSADPAMHIFHYASYEVAAMRNLMGKYATREREVDELLRKHVFVDLYQVVRQGLVIGTPSYSLKDVERLYMTKRSGSVTTAGGSVVAYQRWLDHHDGDNWKGSAILKEIRDYNRVDCESTLMLCQWLHRVQTTSKVAYLPDVDGHEGAGTATADVPPPVNPSKALAEELLLAVRELKVDGERARIQELIAWLLEFHWREAKPVFWRMFSRHEMTEPELVDDFECLGGMQRTRKPREQNKKSFDYEYKFDPDQDTKLHDGSKCFFAHDLAVKCEITSLDGNRGVVVIKLGAKCDQPPERLSLIPNEYVAADPIPQAVYRYAESWKRGTTGSQAVDDLLHRRPPRVCGHSGGPLLDDATNLSEIVSVATRLDNSTLCIQGPPGTGKTFTAAAIVTELLRMGKRVGITATSHECIMNAMRAVARAADDVGVKATMVKAGGDSDHELIKTGRIRRIGSGGDIAAELGTGPIVVGGTAWAFSRDELAGKFDYLIVDEAGQFSLANAVAVGQATRNLILVGDQMQLSQPIQGSHPGESGKSALEYVLQGHATVPPDLGIFLNTTWRMHPHICGFISEAVYEGRLKSHPDAKRQEVRCETDTPGALRRTSGVVFVEVEHQFNSQASDEEVVAVEELVRSLLGRCVVTRNGTTHELALKDILVVAPYNMQVRRLKSRLGPDARVGSVDKFQGQEAAVVIVSMCASSVEECPRGIDFLLNKNRLNVAVSRAKCLAIVVGCRALMSARCNTIEHMEMTNLYCWLAAHAEQASGPL